VVPYLPYYFCTSPGLNDSVRCHKDVTVVISQCNNFQQINDVSLYKYLKLTLRSQDVSQQIHCQGWNCLQMTCHYKVNHTAENPPRLVYLMGTEERMPSGLLDGFFPLLLPLELPPTVVNQQYKCKLKHKQQQQQQNKAISKREMVSIGVLCKNAFFQTSSSINFKYDKVAMLVKVC